MASRLAVAINNEATKNGWSAQDMATVLHYESGFREWAKGPTTKWGVHRGLFQAGDDVQRKYNLYEGMPVEDQVTAFSSYLTDRGMKPGMGLLDMYSAVNAGRVGLYDRSDTVAGGRPGDVRWKVDNDMEKSKAKAAELLGGTYTPPVHDPSAERSIERNAAINYGDNASATTPRYSTEEEQNDPHRAQAAPYSFAESVGAAATHDWYASWATRRMSEGVIDPDWDGIGEERGKQLQETIPEDLQEHVFASSSEENFLSRLQYAQEATEDRQRQSVSGWDATAGRFVGGLTDPAMLPLMAGTGGAATAARMGLGAVGKVAMTGGIGAATNVGTDELFHQAAGKPRGDLLTEIGVGAILGGLGGALYRPHTPTAGPTVQAAEALPNETPLGGGAGSAGASRNPLATDEVISENPYLDQGDVPTGFGGALRQDVTGQMTTSQIASERLFGATMGDEAAGFTDNSVVQHSVSVRAKAIERKFHGNFAVGYDEALRAHLKEKGISWMNPFKRANEEQNFSWAVDEWVQDPNPAPNSNPHVAKAGAAMREFYAVNAKRINESGLSDMKADPHFIPKMTDHNAVGIHDNLYDEGQIHNLVVAAVQDAHSEITTEVAEKIAKGWWNSMRKAGYGGVDGLQNAVNMGSKEDFINALRNELSDAGVVADDDLGEAFSIMMGVADKTKAPAEAGSKGISRLKKRTPMNYQFTGTIKDKFGNFNEVSINSLFLRDSAYVTKRYARTMSGRIALAETQVRNPRTGELLIDGIKTKGDYEKFRNYVREEYRNAPGTHGEKKGKLDNFEANADFMWDRITGIPHDGANTGMANAARRIQGMQFIRLMSNMGWNQVQESWKIINTLGAKAAWAGLPAIRELGPHAAVSKAAEDRLLVELKHMTGIGQEDPFGNIQLRTAEDRQAYSASSASGDVVDRALDFGKKATSAVSLHRNIQGFQQSWAMKGVMHQLTEIARRTKSGDAFDFSKLGNKYSREQDRLASIGLGEEQAKVVFSNLLKHGEFDTDGTLLFMNVNKWDPKAVTEGAYLINRAVDRMVQANDAGGLSKWMSRPVLGMFNQFRSFTMGAWAKSTLYSANHRDPQAFVFLMGEIAVASAMGMMRQGSATLLADGETREQFMEKISDPVEWGRMGIGRAASLSILPMAVDAGLMVVGQKPQFGNVRASGQASDAFFGNPIGDQLKKGQKFATGLADSFINDREMSQQEIKAGVGALPLPTNFAPLAGLLDLMVSDKPKHAPFEVLGVRQY